MCIVRVFVRLTFICTFQSISLKESYQGRDGEVPGMHLLCEPVHLPPGVDEDHSLCDGQGLVQITQRVQLPFLQGNRRSRS